MELPVQNASSSSMNWNSVDDHSTISSLKRERCIMIMDALERNSKMKSRSLTASKEFSYTRPNPSCSATKWRSIGKVVPASAPAPSGSMSTRL
ncbi:hypothetical protein D3C86_1951970 [compost metagenome]